MFDRIDHRVARITLRAQGGPLDGPAHLLSSLADRSKLWIAIAAARALTDGRTGRVAAVRLVTVVGAQSLLVEAGVKRLFARHRPTKTVVPLRFGARRPPSSSFPSGHSASAACAAILLGEGRAHPGPFALLAGAVAWSRVHTGLHHASDAIAGLALGVAVGVAVRRLWPLPGRREFPPASGPAFERGGGVPCPGS